MIFSAKPDRLAVGSILRSKLVFLINVRLLVMRSKSFLILGRACCHSWQETTAANILPSVWTLIMRAIKCLKGVRWMPWR